MVPENIHTLEIPRDGGGGGHKANIFIGKKLNWKIQRVRKGFKPEKKKPTTVGKVWIFCGITHCYRGSLHKKAFLRAPVQLC